MSIPHPHKLFDFSEKVVIVTGSGSGLGTGIALRFAQAGAAVVVNYRLSPQAKYPAYLDDSAAAVAWTLDHIGEHGGDPRKVLVSGHSAGGYLTAMIVVDPRYLAKYDAQPSSLAGHRPREFPVEVGRRRRLAGHRPD